jgi:hypothetical protein
MTTNAQLFEAADAAIRSIKSNNAESIIASFAAALSRAKDASALSAKSVRSIANRLAWTNENISKQVYRLGRIMLAELDDVKS